MKSSNFWIKDLENAEVCKIKEGSMRGYIAFIFETSLHLIVVQFHGHLAVVKMFTFNWTFQFNLCPVFLVSARPKNVEPESIESIQPEVIQPVASLSLEFA